MHMPKVYVENNLKFKGQSRSSLQDRKGTRLCRTGETREVSLLNTAADRARHAIYSLS